MMGLGKREQFNLGNGGAKSLMPGSHVCRFGFRSSLFHRSLVGLILVHLVGLGGAQLSAEVLEIPEALRKVYAGEAPTSLEQLRLMEEHQQKLAALITECTVGIRVGGSQGSGVLISKEGYILTAAHVAVRPNTPCIVILPDGRFVRGTTLGLNRTRDAGLVKIITRAPPEKATDSASGSDEVKETKESRKNPESEPSAEEPPEGTSQKESDGAEPPVANVRREELPEPNFPHLEMASGEEIRQGMWCIATGHPGGYQRERKPVVRLGRILFVSPHLLRSDCILVGGDSGGPLCDMSGRVIGIHSRIGAPITMNLHVPISVFRDSWERLKRGESWGRLPGSRPRVGPTVLGVRGDPKTEKAKILSVDPGLPAEKAGIRPGDLILRFDGKRVPDFATLARLVQSHKPGDVVLIELQRGDELMQLKVTLGERAPSGD